MYHARFKILTGSILFSLLTNFLFRFFPDCGSASAFEELAMPLTRTARPPDRDPGEVQQRNGNLQDDLRQHISCKALGRLSPLQAVVSQYTELLQRGCPLGRLGRTGNEGSSGVIQ